MAMDTGRDIVWPLAGGIMGMGMGTGTGGDMEVAGNGSFLLLLAGQ
jgi:hypothetical protein